MVRRRVQLGGAGKGGAAQRGMERRGEHGAARRAALGAASEHRCEIPKLVDPSLFVWHTHVCHECLWPCSCLCALPPFGAQAGLEC